LFLQIPLIDFAATVIAAAVVRQPYNPTIGHNISVGAVGLSHRGSRKTKITVFYKTDPIPIFQDYVGYIAQCGSFPSNS
jgi:hypothetical protein